MSKEVYFLYFLIHFHYEHHKINNIHPHILFTILETILFIESSSLPTLKKSFIEIPLKHFKSKKVDQLFFGMRLYSFLKSLMFHDRLDLFPLYSSANSLILDLKKVRQFVTNTWKRSPKSLPENRKLIDSLCNIEKHKINLLTNLSVGVLYRSKNQRTREEITGNGTLLFMLIIIL